MFISNYHTKLQVSLRKPLRYSSEFDFKAQYSTSVFWVFFFISNNFFFWLCSIRMFCSHSVFPGGYFNTLILSLLYLLDFKIPCIIVLLLLSLWSFIIPVLIIQEGRKIWVCSLEQIKENQIGAAVCKRSVDEALFSVSHGQAASSARCWWNNMLAQQDRQSNLLMLHEICW